MWRYGIIIIGVLIDQGTKFWARTDLGNPVEIIEKFLQFQLAFNPGIAFSIPIPWWVSSVLSLMVIGYIFWLLRQKSEAKKLGYYFLLAGAFGNLFDRVWFGEVTDFISVLNFPIFNVADALVSIGVVLLLCEEFFGLKGSTHKS